MAKQIPYLKRPSHTLAVAEKRSMPAMFFFFLPLIVAGIIGTVYILVNTRALTFLIPAKEVSALRDYNSKTLALDDGTYRTTFYQNPIHFKDARGNFEDIDARIRDSTLTGYRYQNTTNVVKSFFKETTESEFIRLETEGSIIYYSLADIPGVGSPNRVAAVVSDSQVIYPNVYRGVDVVYMVDVSQNKIFFRINNRETARNIKEIPLSVRTENAEILQDKSGKVFIKSAKGEIAHINSPFLVEENSLNNRKMYPETAPISYKVIPKQNGATLIKHIDKKAHDWLNDEVRIYPILVDPVTVFYPNANPETTVVDGQVQRDSVDQTFSAIRSGAGTAVDDTTATGIRSARLTASTTSNQFQNLTRSIYLFDTRSIVRGTTIIGATLSLYGTNKTTAAGTSPALHIVDSTPASDTALVAGDFSQVGTLSYGNVSYASFSTAGYNDITLTSNAITQGGISKLGAILSWDQSGTFGGTWTSSGEWSFYADYADQTGTSQDPKLTVTWGVGSLWKFDEGNGSSANDSSENANTGTITEATWKTADMCKSGGCLSFDGSNDVVTVTAASSINITGNSGYTMCAWIKPLSDGEADTGQIFNKGTSNYLRVDTESGGTVKVTANIDLATTDATYTSTRTISTSDWSHVCAVYNGSTQVAVYVNGLLDGAGTGSGSLTSDSADNLLIGGGTSNNFNGYIDEARVYPIARTAAQIKADYGGSTKILGTSASLGGNTDSGAFLSKGLVGYWKLDETSGNATDSSGKSSTLTDTNTVAFVSGKIANGGDYESANSEYHYSADNASLSLTGDVTISAWIKPESVTAATLFDIAGKWDGANESYLLAQYGDEIRMYVDSASNYATTDATNLTTGAWYHVVASYQASTATVRIFVNGTTQAATVTGTIPSSIGDDAGRFQIGAEDSTTSAANFYDGVIDEVRVNSWAFGSREALSLSTWIPNPSVQYDFDNPSSVIDVVGGESNASTSTGDAWYNASWTYRKAITIDNTKVDSDLTNFPVYFNEASDTDLGADALDTGDDILFTNTSGTKLDHDLVSFNGTTGAIDTWVEVDSLANSTDTVIYMYYGNAGASAQENVTGTWGNGYAGVWHLEEASGNVSDSTSNGFTGTDANTTTTTGKIGSGRDFNGTNATIDYGTLSGVDFSGDYTVGVWAKFDVLGDAASNCGNQRAAMWSKEESASKTMGFQIYSTGAGHARQTNSGGTSAYDAATSNSSTATWYYFTQVHDNTGNYIRAYRNGALANSTSTSTDAMLNPSTSNLIQGNLTYNCNHGYVDGVMDELRISTTNRSTEWLSTEYNNQNSPSTFYSVGAEADINQGSTAATSTGKYGGARDLESSSSNYFYVADNSELSITGSLAISAWIKPESVTAATLFDIAGKWDGANESYLLALYGDEVRMYIDSASNYATTNSTNLAINTWYHLMGVYNAPAQTVTIYVNGIPQAATTTGTIPTSIGDDAGRFQIGAEDSTTTAANFFDGMVDDVRIYPFALDAKQTINVMNAGHPSVGTPVGSTAGYWRFDEGYATTANDATENNNDLTLSTESWTATGKFGTGFNGTNATWASRADDADFDFAAADSMTVSAWVRSDSTSNPGANEYVISKGAPTAAGYALYFNSSGYPVYAIDDDVTWTTPDFTATHSTDIYDNTWHHVVGIKDGSSTIKIYVDGILRATSASIAAQGTIENASSLVVGDSDATNNGDEFTGDIDEVKIYRFALNAEEVKLEYNKGKAIVFGAQSTTSGSSTPDNSYDREFCVPGDSATCAGPVMHLKMDENTGTSTTYDTSANANNGALTGVTESSWVPGKMGSGLYLDGSGDYVTVTDDSSINFGASQDFTVSMWVKTVQGAAVGTWPAILNKEYDTTGTRQGYAFWLHNEATNLEWYFQLFVAGATRTVFGNNNIADGNWHHIVGVRSGSSIYSYEDGLFSGTSAGSTSDLTRTVPLRVGSLSGVAPGEYFNGSVDDVKIYNYARTAAQIAWEYNHGKPVAHWKLDECTGTTANDSSGNSLTGTITIGATGTNTANGTCAGTAGAWYDGATGKYNGSLEFDDTDDYITVSDNTKLDLNLASGMTLSAWVKTAANEASNVVISKGTSYEMGVNADGDVYWDGAGAEADDGSARVLSGTWHHIVVTNDDTTATYYVDGILTGTDSAGIDTDNATALYIGYDGTNYFDGQIDDARVYTYPLNATQVKILYNENSAVRFGPASGSP